MEHIDIAHIIQLAVAPVFLLAGIAGFLNVVSSRLGRIVDRMRVVERRISRLEDCDELEISKQELAILTRRTHITNKSISLCTCSGLTVCILVVTLFLGDLMRLDISGLIAFLFVLAMLLLTLALLFFLKEIQLATRTMDIAKEFAIDQN